VEPKSLGASAATVLLADDDVELSGMLKEYLSDGFGLGLAIAQRRTRRHIPLLIFTLRLNPFTAGTVIVGA
jgi:hypothetical protein